MDDVQRPRPPHRGPGPDTFGVAYESFIDGGGEVLQETPLVRVRRYRTYHRATSDPDIGRDFLTSTFYVTEFQDEPFLTVDWIVGNDYLGTDNPSGVSVETHPNAFPLGAIDLESAEFLVGGVTKSLPYMPNEHGIQPAVDEGNGLVSYEAIRQTFIDDGQTRRFRFFLLVNNPTALTEYREGWEATFEAFAAAPLRSLATLQTWQSAEAMGLDGWIVNGPADAFQRAQGEFESWFARSEFGTWGSFGEVKRTQTTGTPRNAPVSPELAHAAQGANPRLLQVLEQKAWVQAVRPYHLYGLEVGAYEDILLWEEIPYYPGARGLSRESLGRRALWQSDPYSGYRQRVDFGNRGHGWNGYDHEHWSTDLLFDYWTISGDAWAREELRQLGQSLKGLMRLDGYNTAILQAARAEGWCMTGFVHAYLATADESIKDYALLRIRDVIEGQRSGWHESKALVMQDSHPLTGFPTEHKFYMPWQHAPVIYGFLAAHRFFGDATSLQIAEDTVEAVRYAWVTNYNDPVFGLVRNGLRYYVPTWHNNQWVPANFFDSSHGIKWGGGGSPLGGAHTFLTGALFTLADRSPDPAIQNGALFYANHLLQTWGDDDRWTKWTFTVREPQVQS